MYGLWSIVVDAAHPASALLWLSAIISVLACVSLRYLSRWEVLGASLEPFPLQKSWLLP